MEPQRWPHRRASRTACIAALLLAPLADFVLSHRSLAQDAAPASAQAASKADRLVFLVEYIGNDYENAVRDGEVRSQLEYGEMLRFARNASELYGNGKGPDDRITRGLTELRMLLVGRAEQPRVRDACVALIQRIGLELGTSLPARAPEPAAAAGLYAAHCAACHGASGGGGGDGERAASLAPPPASFRTRSADRLTPRHAYNAITLGIEGTAMAAFAPLIDEASRWDLAFYVMTLRDGFAPKPAPVATLPGLEEVVDSNDSVLLGLLSSRNAPADPSWVDDLRLHPPSPTPTGSDAPSQPDAGSPPSSNGVAADPAVALQDSFRKVASVAFPSVVAVAAFETATTKRKPAHPAGWLPDPASMPAPEGSRAVSAGSGFVFPDGSIATCNHLVRDSTGALAATVQVGSADGGRWTAEVLGAEPTLDLAILRIRENAWKAPQPALRLGDSDAVQAGDWLLAVSDPPGPAVGLSVGVASSAAERQCYQQQRSATMLQSSIALADAASGAAVTDLHGAVVGMVVRLPAVGATETARAESAGLAILPINLALNLKEALTVARSDRSPWLGISVLELSKAPAAVAARGRGVYIDNVFGPSPASRAGIARGDVLLSFDSHEIGSVSDFQKALYAAGIGHRAELRIVRDEKELTLTAPVEERPASAAMQ